MDKINALIQSFGQRKVTIPLVPVTLAFINWQQNLGIPWDTVLKPMFVIAGLWLLCETALDLARIVCNRYGPPPKVTPPAAPPT